MLSLVLLAMGCTEESSEIVVLVDTDYQIGTDMTDLRIEVLDPSRNEAYSNTLRIEEDVAAGDLQTTYRIPLSFVVEAAGGDPSRLVTISVTGVVNAGTPNERLLASRTARTTFVRGERRLLAIFLSKLCEKDCGEGLTCIPEGDEGRCVSIDIDPNDLPKVDPGDELDASLTDAGGDAAIDGGTDDGGIDASAADCTGSCGPQCEQLECGDAMSPCVCTACGCDMVCAAGDCLAECKAGGTTPSACVVDARAATSINASCKGGSDCLIVLGTGDITSVECKGAETTCSIDCSRRTSCTPFCREGAACELTCGDGAGANCYFEGCTDAQVCPDGRVVCGRGC